MASSSGMEEDAAAPNNNKLRVFFIPFFASGHMIPMMDLARLFASHPAVESTMVLTPANAAVLSPAIHRSAASGHPVRLLLYPFPSVASGLPDGLENLATVPAADSWRIYKAVDLSRDQHDRILRDHRPDAVVADIPYWWTTAIASDLGIPRITFHAVGVFPQCVMNNLVKNRVQDLVTSDTDTFLVPDLPGPPVKLVRSELPDFLRCRDPMDPMTDTWDDMKKAQLESYGVVVNTFYELESEYCDLYRRLDSQRAWFVGPVALCYRQREEDDDRAANRESCMKWLDENEDDSVVLVCFGSWCHFEDVQLREIAVGLETSGKAFLWVVRAGENAGMEWMPDKWEERTRRRGLILKGWAPQTAILGHRAVGAFMTHCGWNSVLEATASGKPMLTWPLVFEQFINERLVVSVMGAGIRVWDGFRSVVEKEKAVVPGEAIAKAVTRVMDGKEGEVARQKAQEWAGMAKAAVAEGGTSRGDIDRLIDELLAMRDGKLRT